MVVQDVLERGCVTAIDRIHGLGKESIESICRFHCSRPVNSRFGSARRIVAHRRCARVRRRTERDGARTSGISYNCAVAVVLTGGTRLGPYEITARIGAGGMGEVYRAPGSDLQTSIRVQNSLERGLSYFMAALARLQGMVDAAEHEREGRVLVYLLDEIVQGTNSVERCVAVRRRCAAPARSWRDWRHDDA
jgi:hypothetical protein